MMREHFHIPQPCQQKWHQMSVAEKGRLCASCRKEVVDLTEFTRPEIMELLQKEEKVCGRLTYSQLQPKGKPLPNLFLAKWTWVLGLGSILGMTGQVLANDAKPKIELTENSGWKSIFPAQKSNDSVVLSGKVIDEDELVLPGVNVILKGSEIGVQTNFDGEFTIRIPSEKLKEENFLLFSYLGFETMEYKFYPNNKYLKIEMQADAALLGEVIIIRDQNVFERAGNFFRRLFTS